MIQSLVAKNESMDKSEVIKSVRDVQIADAIVFVGGLPACGKSLMTAIIGSFNRVEIQKYNYTIEHLCSLHYLGCIEEDVATTMIRMQTDMDLYNMMMSRETNFRFKDSSSIFKSPRPFRYLRRLFNPGETETIERIKREKPILNILVHNVMTHSASLAKAVGPAFHLIEIVRHPLYMIKQWHLYIDRYAKDARDFTVWFDYKGHSLPFFVKGWEDLYIRSNPMDRVIHSIRHLFETNFRVFDELPPEQKANVLTVPFEKMVKDPMPYIHGIQKLLNTCMTSSTRRELKKQNVPRKMIADSAILPIYKKYGWEPPEKKSDERWELNKRREFAAQHASSEAMKVLDRICQEYEDRWQVP